MRAYKLTDENAKTKGNTKWGPRVSHSANGIGRELCSDGWIHFYRHPLLAVFVYPIHVRFTSPRLWECETSGEELHEPLKSGCKTLTTIREIPLPKVSPTQRIAFGILCAKKICSYLTWNMWADKWLSGEDRTKQSAVMAYRDCVGASKLPSDVAAGSATYAACSEGVSMEINSADVAAVVDVDLGQRKVNKVNFIELAEKAMTYK